MLGNWKQFLCCVACGEPLKPQGPDLVCSRCNTTYEATANGIPVVMDPVDRIRFQTLLAREPGVQMKELYARRRLNGAAQRFVKMLYPPEPVYVNPKAPPIPQPKGELSLWLGGAGLHLPGFVNVDVVAVTGVNLVANAAKLPFQPNCCDSIACLALLEHVPDPERVVAEMLRVLKPGGEVQVVVPFCHPYHGYPTDYSRFSREGLEKLFAAYDDLEIGIRTGPTTTLLTFITYYSKLIFPVHGGHTLRRGFNRLLAGGLGWAIAPFKYLDIWLNKSAHAHVLANHFYVSARKPQVLV